VSSIRWWFWRFFWYRNSIHFNKFYPRACMRSFTEALNTTLPCGTLRGDACQVYQWVDNPSYGRPAAPPHQPYVQARCAGAELFGPVVGCGEKGSVHFLWANSSCSDTWTQFFEGVNADNVMLVLFCRSSRIEPFEGCEVAATEDHVSKWIHFHAEQEASAGQAAPTNPYYPGQVWLVWPCWACAGLWINQWRAAAVALNGFTGTSVNPMLRPMEFPADGVPWQDLTRDFCC